MSVGVSGLDQDHRHLIDLLNSLHDAITAGSGTGRLGGILDKLVDYTTSHFGREEELFALTGYPGATAHRQQHQTLSKLVLDIQARYHQGAFDVLSLEALNFLKSWLADHIEDSDKLYAAFLNSSGLQ